MLLTDRTLLRLHVEAVWGVRLPTMDQQAIELLPDGKLPPWKLYVARMSNEPRVTIWRPDTPVGVRAACLARVEEALAFPSIASAAPGISREVALRQAGTPAISVAEARQVARLITPFDRALVEAFEAGSSKYYFHPRRSPLCGVVIDGRLLSLAHSSRRTAEACELGIDTLPEARRRGYALAATVLWAASVAEEGLVPLYSALATNTASLHLAAAAGYRPFTHSTSLLKG